MLNLDKLVFEVDTKQLQDALQSVEALEKKIKNFTSSTEDSTRAAIENEKLQKELIKAQKERVRAEESLEKAIKKKNEAEQRTTELLERKGKAEDDQNEKLSAAEKLVQRNEIRYRAFRDSIVDASDGVVQFGTALTASQANTVASLKLLNATNEQMQRYASLVEKVNAQAPVNTFDKSIDGLNKINREISDLNKVNEYLAKGFNLTRDQIQGMNRDIERTVQKMQELGAPKSAIDTSIQEIERDTIARAEQLNLMKAQAAEATRIAKTQAETQANAAKKQRETAQELFNIHQMKLSQDESNYQKEQALLREQLLTEDRLNKEREQSLKSAFDRQVQIHNLKQEQDRKNYDEDMRAMREYYSDIVRQQELADKALQDSQRALLREQGVAKYSGMGYSSRISNAATNLEVQGVDPAVIKSYLDQASANEKTTRALRDKLTAQRAVEAAEERMQATTSHLNDEMMLNSTLNERAALALGTYERNLTKAGYSTEVITQKLAEYKEQQKQISALEAKRQGDYIARGVGVQMGDVAISLAGGMNPLLVAIQQGDQIRGLIQQAGQDGVDLRNVMNDAALQIAESFKDVGIAIGNFIGGAFKTVGDGIYNTIDRMFDVEGSALEVASAFTKMGVDQDKALSAVIESLGVLRGALTVFGGAVLLSFGAFLTAIIKTMNASDELAKSFAQFAASSGMSFEQLKASSYALADSMKVNVTTAMKVVSAFTKSNISDIADYNKAIETATKLNKVFGTDVKDIAKAYADLQDKPYESLMKVAIQTGQVSVETLKNVKALESQGDAIGAARAATEAYSKAMSDTADLADKNLSAMTKLWRTLKEEISDVYNEFEKFADADFWKYLHSSLLGFVYLLKQLQNLGKLKGNLLSFDTEGTEQGIKDILKVHEDYAGRVKNIWGNSLSGIDAATNQASSNAAKRLSDLDKALSKFSSKSDPKKLSLQQFVAEGISRASKEANQPLIGESFRRVKTALEKEWKDANDSSKKAAKDSFDQQKVHAAALEKFSDIEIQVAKARARGNETVIESTKAYAALQDIINSSTWNKRKEDNQIEILQEYQRVAAIEIELLQIEKQNKAIKEQKELQEELLNVQNEYQIKSSESLNEIHNRTALIGLTEEQKQVTQALLEVEQKRRAAIEKINAAANKKLAGGSADILDTEGQRILSVNEANSFYDQQLILQERAILQNQKMANSFETGWTEAFNSYASAAKNSAEIGKKAFDSMTNGMTDALTEWAMTGKLTIKDFANTFIREMIRMQMQQVAAQATSGIGSLLKLGASFLSYGSGVAGLQSAGDLGSGWVAGSAGLGWSSGGYTGPGGVTEPAGIVHKGEVVWSQKDVANAGGVGVVEAMRRGIQGSTPVQQTVTESSVVVNVVVNGDGSSSVETNPAQNGKQFGDMIANAVRQEILKEKRNGGLLASTNR